MSGIGHPSSPDDPQASLRAELLGQLVAAQFDIEAVINEVAGNATALSENKAQLQLLSALQRQISTASPVALAGLRSEIAATVSAAQAIAQQSRESVTTNDRMAELRDVTNATRSTIQNVAGDLFEKKKLDPYLQFASAEDEAEYRKREAERQEYIKKELAKGTPEGTLNATNATLAQIKDAGTHGADRSPDYGRMHNDTLGARDRLLASMREAGVASQSPLAPAISQTEKDSAELDEIAAVFKAADVQSPPDSGSQQSDHGLAGLAIERGGNTAGRSA